MTWTGNETPRGDRSVRDNKVPLQNNFRYLEDTLKVDHFFADDNSDNDGHHQFVQMPKFQDGSDPDNPSIANNMQSVFYTRDKTTAESPNQQRPEPFVKTFDGITEETLQLGFKALVNFSVSNGIPTIQYSHNVSSVQRDGAGLYTINFTNPIKTNRYVVTGSGMLVTPFPTSDLSFAVRRQASIGTAMSTSLVRIAFSNTNTGIKEDPGVGMVCVMGG